MEPSNIFNYDSFPVQWPKRPSAGERPTVDSFQLCPLVEGFYDLGTSYYPPAPGPATPPKGPVMELPSFVGPTTQDVELWEKQLENHPLYQKVGAAVNSALSSGADPPYP